MLFYDPESNLPSNINKFPETKVKTEETAVMADDGLGVYKCQNCMADFTTPARLTRHISMVHASRAVAEQGLWKLVLIFLWTSNSNTFLFCSKKGTF